MRLHKLSLILVIYLIPSCSSNRKAVDKIREISYYSGNIRMDSTLKPSCFEKTYPYGDLIIGTFGLEFCHYIYPDTNDLVRIKLASLNNEEYTLIENFFYKNDELVYAERSITELPGKEEIIKVFLSDGKIINKFKGKIEVRKKLIEEGLRHLTDYKASL